MSEVRSKPAGIHRLKLRGVNAYLVNDEGLRPSSNRTQSDDVDERSSSARQTQSDDGGTLTLVDAGTPRDAGAIRAGIEKAGYEVGDVERVLLTHFDLDHAGALADLSDLDATVYVGEADAPLVAGRKRPTLRNHKGVIQFALGAFYALPGLPVVALADGETIGSFTAYHTPGHTPGHMVYVSSDLSAAFLGDLVRERNGELVASPWFLSYDTEEVKDSIRDLVRRAPDFEVAATGHGTPFSTGGSEVLKDLLLKL